MKHLLFLCVLLLSTFFSTAQDQTTIDYAQDSIWLKSGLVIPCIIIEDSTTSESVSVYFVNAIDRIDCTRFTWTQIKKIHQQSKPYQLKTADYVVELKDGTTLNGRILEESDTQIVMQLESVGQLTIDRVNVSRIVPLGGSKKARKPYWFENPHATRLLFAPTAIPLKKGEAYYQNIYVFGNMFNYGIIDNLSVGAGFDFITMFSQPDGEWKPILNFNIKSGFQISENLHAAVGGIYATMLGEFSAGILYGNGTYGNYNSNITLGLGWGFIDGTFESKPFIMIGGMARISEKLWFVSENWIVPVEDPGYYVVFSYGLRFASRRIAVDLAFINSKDIAEDFMIFGFPFVDFVVKIGKK